MSEYVTPSQPTCPSLSTCGKCSLSQKCFWGSRGTVASSWRRRVCTHQSLGVILATINRLRGCQKANRDTEILHKHEIWSYMLQKQHTTSWCRTYASREGMNAKILSAHLCTSAGPPRTSLRGVADGPEMRGVCCCAGSKWEKGAEAWTGEKMKRRREVLEAPKSQTWRSCLERRDVLGLQQFPERRRRAATPQWLQLSLAHVGAQDKPITPREANLFNDLLSVCLSFSPSIKRKTDRCPCFWLCGTSAVKPAKQEKMTNLFHICWRWHTCIRVSGSFCLPGLHMMVCFPLWSQACQ